MAHENHDEAGVDHGAANFERRIEYHLKGWMRLRLLTILPQSSQHILHIDDGIIDKFTECNGQASERHRVQKLYVACR